MPSESKARVVFRWLLAIALIAQGVNHFIADEIMARMIPAYLPAPYMMVWLSGVAEVFLGVMLLVPKLRVLAGWGIIALLIAVFPANLQMALHPEQWPDIPSGVLWARLPFQLLFIYWAWAVALAEGARPQTSPRSSD